MTAFRFIEVEKAVYPISMLCRLVGVSASGYHAWRRRRHSALGYHSPAEYEKITTKAANAA